MNSPDFAASGPNALLEHPDSATFRLEGGNGTLDHDQLDGEVRRSADRLREEMDTRPIARGRVATAAVHAPRSHSSTVVLLLSLWRLGIVPLLMERGAPENRIMAAHAVLEPALVLSLEPTGGDDTVDVLGAAWRLRTHSPGNALESCPDPAYVAMTSGSTGAPLLTLCRWSGAQLVASRWAADARLTPGSRVLQLSSPAYDAIYTELLPTLVTGGTLVCLDDESWSKPRRLAQSLARRRVTHVTAPPSYAARLFATGEMPHVSFLGLAGERLDADTAEAACIHADRVLNAYGPAEATVCVSTQEVEPGMTEIPLGTPWPHVRASIDDGEIVLGGPAVAWGYLGAPPEATRFQFDALTGTTSLRTGDLGEFRDGKLYFRGRRDGQVKLSGHRADLKTIEWTVRRLAGVTDCAVILVKERPACLVVSERPIEELSADLRLLLPAAEWPGAWRRVEDIPYLSSDKVDLGSVARLLAEQDTEQVTGPTSDLEPEWLASNWRLHAKLVGSTDDFFSSGGDSLGAMELLDAVYDASGIDIDVGDFLTSPTFDWLRQRVSGG
jgi:acyl-CoA synthetase (AMP-forming)/AMP-acid ligase II